jgi:hypothetical protein
MFRRVFTAGLAALLFLVAAPASAQFLAADLIYLPAAASTGGANGSQWRSDLYITNVDTEDAIDVALVYAPTGLINNGSRFITRDTWLGGREGDGFGYIDPILADIPPGGTVILRDPIGNYWNANGNVGDSGGIVLFAYEANTLEDDGTRVLKNALLNTRVYTPNTFYQPDPDNEGEFIEVVGTYGQTLPGVPWYNLADSSAVGENGDFSFQMLTGATENEEVRYNVGIFNASDPLTTLNVQIQPFQGNGEPFPSAAGGDMLFQVTVPPGGHVQYNSVLLTLFGFAVAPDDVRIDISIVNWASGNSEPVVGMTTYGNYIDSTTNDPIAILPAFAYPYNVECQWEDAKSGSGSTGRMTRRPLEIPPR